MTDETTTYEVVTRRGTSRVTVPSTYKVTFGAVVPGKSHGETWGLRFWESTDKQRMVISEVLSYRDISIPVTVKACRLFGSKEWFAENSEWADSDKVERAWKDANDLIKAPPRPPADTRPIKSHGDHARGWFETKVDETEEDASTW